MNIFMGLQKTSIINQIKEAKALNKRLLALLLDPDKLPVSQIQSKVERVMDKVDFFLVGGSLMFTDVLDNFIVELKKHVTAPVILFPGNAHQISAHADGILFLQLLSGRNPDFLIGQHVSAAPILKSLEIEILPTSYLLIESGRGTTASYISNTQPIPAHKPEIAMATALAGEYLGHQLVYLDGGSGALNPVPIEMIQEVSHNLTNPVIVGGGIRTKEQMQQAYKAGATLVVVGTAFEEGNFTF
jgi:putative glycerol-1-phosphate prenyltransferase